MNLQGKMKQIIFIYPNPHRSNPRGIRTNNIVRNLKKLAPDNKYSILSFSEKLYSKSVPPFKTNSFNLIYLLFKYMGVFKTARRISKTSKLLDPFVFIHFLIKWDIMFRLREINNTDNIVFVVIVSPFSNYLLVPWLIKNYPNAKIICDIGDPLYKNSARWNNDKISRNIESKALNASSFIIATNEATKDHFVSEFNLNPSNVFIIPQGANTELIDKVSRNNDVKINKQKMAYAGRFYEKLRSPKALFDALSSLSGFELDVYGNNPKLALKNVNFHNSLPQEELFIRLAEYGVLVFIDNKSGIQTSGKIFELLAFKKIILFIKGDEETANFKLANKFQNVIFCEHNQESIIGAISKIDTLLDLDINYDSNIFSWEKRVSSYLKVIEL